MGEPLGFGFWVITGGARHSPPYTVCQTRDYQEQRSPKPLTGVGKNTYVRVKKPFN